MSTRSWLFVLALLGCTEKNPHYNGNGDGGGGTDSTSGTDAGSSQHDAGIACTQTCAGVTPVCDGTTGTCRACVKNSECDADVCLANGSCATASQVAYVTGSGGSDAACTKAAPCATIAYTITRAPYVRLLTSMTETVNIGSGTTELVGDTGITLGPTNGGDTIVTVHGVATSPIVTISQLELTGTGSNGAYVTNGTLGFDRARVDGAGAFGVYATNASVTMDRTYIESNTGGGLYAFSTPFTIRNSVIAGNGSLTGLYGGVFNASNSQSSVQFSTIVQNMGAATNNGNGIACSSGETLANDIIYANTPTNNGVQTNCSYTYSDVQGGTNGGTNINGDPMLNSDFSLMADSPAINAASPTSSDPYDILGTPRPQGSGSDMGAFEYKQP